MRTRFNAAEAAKAVEFFPRHLAFGEGSKAGRPFVLEQFQADDISYVFGQQRYDSELRRWVRLVSTVYEELPRKNGKSSKGAGIALKGTFADGEPGAQNFSVAADLEQANRIFSIASRMVQASPTLSARAKLYRRAIEDIKTGNVYRVIPGDAAGNLHHNPHIVVFDEIRTQPNRELWDVMTTGGGTRAQPLTWGFTTAGTDEGIWFELRSYGEKIRAGLLPPDPSFHYIRYGIEEGEDWRDEEVWRRCNPALGIFLRMSFLRSEFAKATASPDRENAFRNLYLNEKTHQVSRYIPMEAWDATAGMVDAQSLVGSCYAGLDVAAEQGLAAFVIVVPDDEGGFDVVPRFWLPGANIEDREHRDGAPYREWVRAGLLELTEGNVRDNDAIEAGILDLLDDLHLDVEEVGYRRTGALELVLALQDQGLTMVPIGATAAAMNEGTVKLLDLVLGGKLRHSGNQPLRWEADSLAVRRDTDGNVKPDQSRSTVAIPGMLALIRALDRAIRSTDGGSAYDDHGLVVA